jgi:hypothetical protein
MFFVASLGGSGSASLRETSPEQLVVENVFGSKVVRKG